jgi:hypothetical protein
MGISSSALNCCERDGEEQNHYKRNRSPVRRAQLLAEAKNMSDQDPQPPDLANRKLFVGAGFHLLRRDATSHYPYIDSQPPNSLHVYNGQLRQLLADENDKDEFIR